MSARLIDIDCAACLHVLQAHDGPDVRRLGNMCVLGTCMSCVRWKHACLAAQVGLLGFFMLEVRGPYVATGYVAVLELTSGRR
jgi:hypothetical protein